MILRTNVFGIIFFDYEMNLENKYLLFDEDINYGSCEHFFHFMWGYFLPALFYSLTIEGKGDFLFVFRSCGPVMDSLISEIYKVLGLNLKILAKEDFTKEQVKGELVVIDRWDNYLRNYKAPKITGIELIDAFISKSVKDKIRYRNKFIFVKRMIFEALKIKNDGQSYLILKRSDAPDFYDKEKGQAEIKTYGTSRRSLVGLEKASELLNSNNISSEVFEPGKISLTKQIQKYAKAKGIIGVRGAEFANQLWLPDYSEIILIQPQNMTDGSPQKALAHILGYKYIQIETNEVSRIPLDGRTLLSILEK